MLSKRAGDRLIALSLYGLGLFWLVSTLQIDEVTLPGAPGPRFFPLLVDGFLMLFATILFVPTFKRQAAGEPSERTQPTVFPEPVSASVLNNGEIGTCIDPDDLIPDRHRVAASFALIVGYVVLADLIGFYTATLISIFALLKFVVRGKSWIKAALTAGAITATVFIIFTLVLRLSLPDRFLP